MNKTAMPQEPAPVSPAARRLLQLAWKPIVEDLEQRRHLDANTVQTLPFVLDFGSNRGELVDKDGQGTGFTRTQANNFGNSYQPQLIDLDTAAGVLKLTTTGNATNGGNAGADNSLVNALETQFDGQSSGFIIQARLKGPLTYLNDPFEQGGIYFGPDQDNYVKLVAIRTQNGNFLQFRDEQNQSTVTLPTGSQAQEVPIGSFASINSLDLRLVGDAASGRVTAFYAINGGSFVKVPAELTLSGSVKTAFFNATSRAGIMAFHKNNVGPVTVTFDSFEIRAGTPIAGRPTITGTRPGNGATGVSRDAFVAADLNLPNVGGGVDVSTLSNSTVRLRRTADGVLVPGTVDTTGGGDAIVYQPSNPLDANTNYTFEVTDQVRDTTGAAFIPFSMSFTTGTAGGQVDTSVSFEKLVQNNTTGQAHTGLKFGPDGRLYSTTIDGKIIRYNVNADGTLGTGQVINTIINREGGPRMVLSIDFHPSSTANNLIAYVSHGQYAGLPGLPLADNFTGKITRLTGSNLENATDTVVGLARSVKDHQNYQAVFGPDGKLYVNVSSMSAKGAPDNAWGLKNEVLMSAAILQIDVNAIGTGTVNVRTEGISNPYNPFASNAPVKIYATGLRSAYDILFHSNGSMYSATNGSAAGGNTPAKPGVPGTGLTNVSTQNDYLFRILQNGYYGHPNPLRNEYILQAGNPTSGFDPGEIEPTPERPAAYPVGTQPESSYRGFVYNFGKNYSPNGMIEYRGNAFNGALDGKILIVRYSGGDDVLVLEPGANGTIAGAKSGYAGFTGFIDPLDIAQHPSNGFLYVAEYGGQRITLLRPITPGGGSVSADKNTLLFNDVTTTSAVTTGNRQTITLTNNGTGTLTVSQMVLSGSNANQFSLVNAPGTPFNIAPGQTQAITVAFTATSTGIKTATLTLSTNDPNNAQMTFALRGLGTAGEGGNNEPSLQRILDLRFGTNVIRVGDPFPDTTDYPQTPSTPNDEVVMQRLQKAGSGPVTVELIANFANSVSPSSRFGWYSPGDVGFLNRLFNVNQADAQSVNPTPQGVTSFDPGSAAFGIYGQFPAFNDRVVYSEDALNAWETNAGRKKKVRFFALKDSGGNVVPNAFVFSFEEWNVNYDQNDLVGIIRNVRAAADQTGPEIGVENLDGQFLFPDRLVFSRIWDLDDDFPNTVHDTATLRIRNTGASPLNITSIVLSSSDWQIVSGGGTGSVSPGAFRDVTVKFVHNRTSFGTEIRSGTLTINSNDADEPQKRIELRGMSQFKSENNSEPGAQALLDLFGYKVKTLNTGQSFNTSGNVVKVGEEVLSSWWQRADTALPVTVRMLAAYHQQGPAKISNIRWFNQTTSVPSSTNLIYRHFGLDGQTILPRLDSTDANPPPAIGTFTPGTTFGWKIDGHHSHAPFNVPNSNNDGGHAMRWYAAKDRDGNLIPNTYLLLHDYTGAAGVTNYDYQDNIHIVYNVKPLSAPTAPTGVSATGSSAGINIRWTANTEGNVIGYNVYRAATSGGPFTKINALPINGTQTNDLLAPAGVTSHYRVMAVNAHGAESAHTATSAFRPTDSTPPAQPTGLTASGTSSGIVLNWNDNGEVDLAGYNIYRASSSSGPFSKLNAALRTLSDFTDTAAPAGATSFYRVSAVDASGNESTFATISAFRPNAGDTPAAAGNATATANSPTSVTVTWSDNSTNETGFRVERRLASAQTWQVLGTAAGNATAFTDLTTTAGTAYAYRVIAFNGSGDAAPSNEASVTTPTLGPAAPTQLTAAVVGTSAINLAWVDNASNETGYRVEFRRATDANFTVLATLPADSTSHAAVALLEGTAYVFRVIAVNGQGDSAPSNEATATTTSQFTSVDIGGALPVGQTNTVTNGVDYDLLAGGADIWGSNDSFRFAYKQVTGDFDIRVRVASVTPTDPLAQAGIMARASLTSGAQNVFMRTDASNRFRFAFRATQGGTTSAQGSSTHPAGLGYLRLIRTGSTFTGMQSTDGVNWTVTGTTSIASMPNTLFFGFAASSKNSAQLNTVQYRGYSETGQPAPTAPAAPSGLSATLAGGQVNLSWVDGSDNESGFRIERRAGASGAFASLGTVAAGVTAFVDSAVSPGVSYTYRVIAFNTVGESPASNEASVSVPPLVDAFTSNDIGNPPAGATTVVTPNSDYDLVAGGFDVFGSSDSFRFVHKLITGDFDVRVRVTNLTGPAGQVPQAGLMARAGLSPDAPHVAVRFDTNNSVLHKWRATAGATTNVGVRALNLTAPWVRITRVGNTFTTFYSTDGINYTPAAASVTLDLPATLNVGMWALSKSMSNTASAQFRGFTEVSSPAPSAPAAASSLTATLSELTVNLAWADNSDNEIGFRVERRANGGTFENLGTVQPNTTFFADNNLSPDTVYTYRVIALGAGDAHAAPSNEASIQTPGAGQWVSQNVPDSPLGSTNVLRPNGDYDIAGAGVDIAGTADNFRFVHQAITGDFDVRVRIDSIVGASGFNAQAGLMARATLDANSRHVNVRLDQANTVMFKHRASTGGTTTFSSTAKDLVGPVWVRLQRVGNTFIGFHSVDGTTWIERSRVTMSMPSTLLVGMTTVSRSSTELATVQFRDLTVA